MSTSALSNTPGPKIVPTVCVLELYVKDKAGEITAAVGTKGDRDRVDVALRAALDALRKLARERGVDDSQWIGAGVVRSVA